MKSFFVLTSLALSVLAQQATIVSPTAGSVLFAGSTVTVEVQQAEAATNDMQVAALIGFRSCPGGDCSTFDPATDGVGPNVVFAGAFTPAHDPNQPQKGLFQDFTFQIPEGAFGNSVFSLGHLQAVGANNVPMFNMSTVVVSVV
ncbi:uncharacterized protein TRAVEDRAFT_49919 [Trametes versicolor FP-101664 SS1]|uniref:uncharacterized protein n=1 Tax=Trametes versicolor (strain FP-101664) TaxID=717944 RepID=UPI00046225DD|nr:uncharacterized protein TRAVEDRAFT_49919 [Trametes versicolor FP-101664 SS1]EIW55429.1 hypothetical protein TRAVEDRAFT_49919 [Trametes versicolor FP-101664 SS1]